MVELASRHILRVANGGTRGEALVATADGRLLVAQTGSIDQISPISPPHVTASIVPNGALIPLPLNSLAVQFDQDMWQGADPRDPASVLNPANYSLVSTSAGTNITLNPGMVSWNEASHSAVLTLPALLPGGWRLQVSNAIRSAYEVKLANSYATSFTTVLDFSSQVKLTFGNTRANHATGAVSYDVSITNIGMEDVHGPLILLLDPGQYFGGQVNDGAQGGGAQSALWTIDLSAALAAQGGRLGVGATLANQTVTVGPSVALNAAGQLIKFDMGHGVYAVPYENAPPAISVVSADSQTGTGDPVGDGTATTDVFSTNESGPVTIPITLIATYRAADGRPSATTQVTQNLAMNVLAAPVAPQFAPPQIWHTLEGQPLGISVFAFDPANPDFSPPVRSASGILIASGFVTPSVSYQVDGLPPGASFDADTLQVNWTPDYSQAGDYSVTVTATSNGGTGTPLSSVTVIPIVVEPVIRPPLITSIGKTLVAQEETLDIPVSAVDPAGNPITFSVSGMPPFGTFTQPTTCAGGSAATSTLHFAPASYSRRDYTITVTASDNGGGDPGKVQSSSTTFVLASTSFTEPPQITLPQQVVAVAGQVLRVPILATDMDQDPLSFTAQGLPAGAKIVTGTLYGHAYLEWTPAANTLPGAYDVSVIVTDSGLPPNGTPLPIGFVAVPNVVAAGLTIVVKASNAAPHMLQVQANGETVADLADHPGTTLVNGAEGQALAINLQARDPEGDMLRWTVDNLPADMTLIQTKGSDGQAQLTLNWTPNLFASRSSGPGNANGLYTFTARASDGMAEVVQTIQVKVAHVNQIPVISRCRCNW